MSISHRSGARGLQKFTLLKWESRFTLGIAILTFFFLQEKAISSSYMWIRSYEIIYNSSASNYQQLCARKKVCNPSTEKLENEKNLE